MKMINKNKRRKNMEKMNLKRIGIFEATKVIKGNKVFVRYTSGGRIGTAYVK